jgi:hypothetical protein
LLENTALETIAYKDCIQQAGHPSLFLHFLAVRRENFTCPDADLAPFPLSALPSFFPLAPFPFFSSSLPLGAAAAALRNIAF